jgi:hypothetical protein
MGRACILFWLESKRLLRGLRRVWEDNIKIVISMLETGVS